MTREVSVSPEGEVFYLPNEDDYANEFLRSKEPGGFS